MGSNYFMAYSYTPSMQCKALEQWFAYNSRKIRLTETENCHPKSIKHGYIKLQEFANGTELYVYFLASQCCKNLYTSNKKCLLMITRTNIDGHKKNCL